MTTATFSAMTSSTSNSPIASSPETSTSDPGDSAASSVVHHRTSDLHSEPNEQHQFPLHHQQQHSHHHPHHLEPASYASYPVSVASVSSPTSVGPHSHLGYPLQSMQLSLHPLQSQQPPRHLQQDGGAVGSQAYVESMTRSGPPPVLTGLAIPAPGPMAEQDAEHDPRFAQGYHPLGPYSPGLSSPVGQHPMQLISRADQDEHVQYGFSAFPQGEQHPSYESPPMSSPATFFQSYAHSPDGPIIHHRNSIAGSSMPTTVVRSRRAGSLATLEDGPFFSNTTQYHNMYNMTRTQQYKVRVMARIDRGFFTANKVWTCYRRNYFQVSTAFNILGFDHARESEAPCLIEIPDQGLVDQESDLQRVDANSMAGTLSGLQLNDNECNNKGPEPSSADNTTTKTRMAIVTHFSICIGSRIASSEKKIELIQHTPKRDKGPQIVPLPRPILGGGSLTLAGEVNTQSVATFERVQFKTATANNGKRRAAQQFYTLLVDLFAHLEDGRTVLVASSASDPLVVRGRSPGHYVDTPERDSILMGGGPLSPTIGNGPGGNGMVGTPLGERRLSSASQHSHSYFSPYPATHSRSHSLSAGAGMTVDMASLGLAIKGAVAAGPGPLSPLSPVGGDFHSPTAGTPHGFFSPYGHPGGNAAGPGGWVDASSLSSPSSVYDGSAFSSPTTTAAVAPGFSTFASPYGHTGSPQERGAGNSVVVGTSAGQGLGSGPHAHHQHHGQSYFPQQRQHSFGSITPRLMGGPGTGQPFETRLEPPLEQSYENEHESEVTDRSSVSLASTMATTTATTIAVSAATAAVVASSGYLPPIPFQTAVSTHQPMIKSEPRDEYFPYAGGAYAVPGSAMGGMGGMGVGATPLSADQVGLQTPPSSSTSTASSFGYPVQETRTHGGVIAGGYDGASYDPSGASHYGAMAGAGMPYIGGPQAQSILPSHGVVMEQRRAVWNGADA